MSYQPSPRPTFDGPAPIPYAGVTRHLWGDLASGEVADWIYVSSDKIHQIVFGLPPGGVFRHSEAYRTIFAADEVLYVLAGTLVLSNPQTGEVHLLRPGEAAFFRRDTWHHAWSYGEDALRVLELFAPPPSQGTSGAYARTKDYLVDPRYVQDEWLGRWPMDRAEAAAAQTIQALRAGDVLWRMEGDERPALVGILASTEHLTVGTMRLLPGQRSEPQVHGGAESLYVLSGTLNVRLLEHPGPCWFELAPKDGFYLPEGVAHQYYNVTDAPVEFIFGVAPRYLPDAAPNDERG
ncbi:MAG TPA: cupin domain-containing protein [Thermomicrobiales bacterium]|nr:cupin domain-containing protein [Thermomicrobiales bacterium]